MKQFKTLSIYAFTIFFNAAISFGTFSLLTHYLNEVDYGIINLYTSLSVSLIPFIAAGVQFVLSVDYFKLSVQEFRNHFTNALVIPIVFTVFFTVLFLFFHTELEHLLGVNFLFAAILPFSCFMAVLNEIFLNLFRNKRNHFLYAGFSIIKNILEVGITILLVVVISYKWEGRLAGSFIASFAALLFIVFIIYKWRLYTGVFNKSLIYAILVTGLPFIPERLSIFVLSYSDRFFINHYRGTAEVGYYGAGAQIAVIVTLAIITLNNTFYPSLFNELSARDINYKKLKKILLVFIALSAIVTFCVLAITPLLFRHFIGPSFQPGKIYAFYLTIALFFWAIYNVFIVFLLNLKKNKLIMGISLFGVVLSLTGNFFNVKYFGPIGATYTSVMVYCAMAGVTIYYVNKFYGLGKFFHEG
jgi:O-antigen/teichoic acid export membrane protein